MTGVPDGWAEARLDDLKADEPRSITDGPFGSNLASAHYTPEGARVVRLQNIGDGLFNDARAFISMDHFGALRQHDVLPGDLLIASLGEDLPRACLAPSWLGPAIVKADCIRVRLSDRVDPRWVMYAMQTPAVRRWASEQLHGVGRPRLGLKVIRSIPVPLPVVSEQHRIVEALEDHLSHLDAAERGFESALKRSASFERQLVIAALTGDGDPGPRSSGPSAAGTDDRDLPSIPADWLWCRLGQVADVVGGVTKDAKKQSDPTVPEVPYLRVANVQRGRLDLSVVTTIRVPAAKASALELHRGDVLLNEGGDRDKLGRGWVWEGQIPGCIHQNHVFRARVKDDLIDPYLLSWVGNYIGGAWCERNGKQSVNLASISLSKIKLMPVPVPPRDGQPAIRARIEGTLEAVQSLRQSIEANRVRASGLRRSLLAAAFSGRLTGTASDLERAEEAIA